MRCIRLNSGSITMMSTLRVIESQTQRNLLLNYARSLCDWVTKGRIGDGPARPKVVGQYGGSFVTFWKGRNLRGCMGSFESTSDIAASVASVTELSLNDPRFRGDPITTDELGQLVIEISVLSDLVVTDDPLSLVPGRHGIVVRRGFQSGCFLPKVASDRNWSAEEFLSQCCTMKAGLAPDAWRDPDTEVLFFQADVFSENTSP